ncbi:HAD family hydrolase [Salipaludibacillus daqingensis]|uniref:HAD family hydrolase n=1 Tax=Salipaludibacillus daqingensis TaxID=3041001 RepID=UPI0024734007|nr:HAD family hydrolase [Salipaludibacillus daqingensis]
MVKAIALDMDGTLLNDNHQISHELVDLLAGYRQQGIRLFLATGRTLKEVKDVLPDEVKVDGIVGGNGMVVEAEGEILVENEVERDLVDEVIKRSRSHGLYYEIHPFQGHRFVFEEDKASLVNEVTYTEGLTVEEHEWKSRTAAVKSEISWVEQYPESKIIKVYFFSKDLEKMKKWIGELYQLKDTYPFSTSSSSNNNVEVMALGINKATGVKKLLNYFSVDHSQLLAVGDANNDLPLLHFAGKSAVMKNGSEEVKQEIQEVTDNTNEENGLYHYLKKSVW